jgi:hypothetical protein
MCDPSLRYRHAGYRQVISSTGAYCASGKYFSIYNISSVVNIQNSKRKTYGRKVGKGEYR